MSARVYRSLRAKRDLAQAETTLPPAPKKRGMAHQHRAKTTVVTPFIGAVSRSENRWAHGGVTFVHRCSCGAVKKVNANGCHREHGPWET